MGDHEGTPQKEHDDTSMKTKPILTRSGESFETLGINGENIFLLY